MKFTINTFFFLLFPLLLFSQTDEVLELGVSKSAHQNMTDFSFFEGNRGTAFETFFDGSKYDSVDLEISVSATTWLFVNENLLTKIEKEAVFYFRSKEKIKEYKTANFSFTFYTETTEKPIVKLLSTKPIVNSLNFNSLSNLGKKISKNANHKVVYSGLLLLLFLLYLKVAKIPFGLSFLGNSIRNILQGLGLEEKKTLSEGVAFVLFYAMFLTYLFAVFFINFWRNTANSYITFLIYFGTFVAVLAFRFFLMKVLTTLFYAKEVFTVHSSEFINTSRLLIIPLTLFFTVLTIKDSIISSEIITNILMLIVLVKSIIIIFRVNKLITLQKTYLFAYFCTSELLPTIVTIKVLSIV